MTDDDLTEAEAAERAFAKAVFGRTDEPVEDDKETVTPEPEPTDDDHQAARLIFNPTERES